MSRITTRDMRHISLARALHARLYVNCEGRIFSVGGQVTHEKIAQVLARQDRCPTAAEAPTPCDLGVPTCDGELNQEVLHSISHVLNRWRKELQVEMRRRPARRRRLSQLDREHEEIERLVSRLTIVRQWQAAFVAGKEPAGAPFFLDSIAESSLRAALDKAQCEYPLPPLIAWQARVVFWLSGECATRRFLAATTGLLSAYPAVSRYEQVRGFQQAVMAWRKRSPQEQLRNLFAEMTQHIRRLRPDVVRAGQFSVRLRGRTFHEHCDLMIERCLQLLTKEQLHRWHILPAALAALSAADGSTVPLPLDCFRADAEKENCERLARLIGKLAEQIGQPGYNSLLLAIEQLPGSLDEFELGQLRQLLGKGNSLADAVWACSKNLLPYLAESSLSIPAARGLSDAFAKRGCPLGRYELTMLVIKIRHKGDLALVKIWLAWLGSVSPSAFTPRMQKVLLATLLKLYLPSARQPDWVEQIVPCLATVRCGDDSQDSTRLLERIAVYQKLVGNKATLPKSLRKLLESDESRLREREHLRTRLAAGTLDAAATSRLHYLENVALTRPDAAKIRRAAEEVFLLLGIDAMGAVTRRLAEAMCRTHLGDLVSLLARDQLLDFALWIEKMKEPERDRLRRLIAARTYHGREYKRHLDENADWIAKAVVRGIDLGPWFDAEAHVEVIGGRTMEIVLVSDLHNIFLMGEYFDTCLGLGNMNEMAVLTNAYDANKQVVFMFTEDDARRRQVVARQLIAVSSDFKLLGYCCYMSWRHVDKARHQEVLNAMASYCGRLAAQCGMELANQGVPEEIEDHFWYDDGAREWPEAAREAWAGAGQETEGLVDSVC